MHTGFDYCLGDPGDNIVQYQIQPGFFVAAPDEGVGAATPVVPPFVDTGPIPAQMFHLFNFELGGALGPCNVQSEVRFAVVDQIGGPVVAFSGAYAEATCVLTGEVHPYDYENAVFRRVMPNREFYFRSGGGALEASLGWSYINLNDKNITGGGMQTYSMGLNWYLHRYAKFQFVVIPVTLERGGASSAAVAAARTQVEF
ncbi:MAG: porin [Pirellulaceae bacterium]